MIVTPSAGMFGYFLREAASDVSGAKILGLFEGIPIELDYVLAAGAAMAEVDSFVTPPNSPSVAVWDAGAYQVGLDVIAATSINYYAELWQTDSSGADVAQIGSTPASQAGAAQATFSFDGVEIDAGTSARLKLKLYAENTDSVNSQTLSVMASDSNLATAIKRPLVSTNAHNTFRRGRFLQSFLRPGEGSERFNDKGITVR